MNPKEILKKYVTGAVTPAEKLLFQEWLQGLSEEEYHQLLRDHADIMAGLKVYRQEDPIWLENIFERMEKTEADTRVIQLVPPRKKWWRVRIAVAVFLLVGVGAYFLFGVFHNASPGRDAGLASATNDIPPPKGAKTILILGNGRQIILDSVQNGILAQQGNTKIAKVNNNQLAYNLSSEKPSETFYNTLSTVRGGQTMVVLADGTKVWLNALSSLRYPTGFTGKDRTVELSGEAYFEVAKEANKPFYVNVQDMQVEVLGTSFDIKAYSDEKMKRTTLLEGSVRISLPGASSGNAVKMLPGQQAQQNETWLQVTRDIDLDEVMAWKNGRFHFNGASIHSILQQAARWYDMRVIYRDSIRDSFSGEIPRDVPVSQLLNILSATDKVKFEINGNNVTVLKR